MYVVQIDAYSQADIVLCPATPIADAGLLDPKMEQTMRSLQSLIKNKCQA